MGRPSKPRDGPDSLPSGGERASRRGPRRVAAARASRVAASRLRPFRLAVAAFGTALALAGAGSCGLLDPNFAPQRLIPLPDLDLLVGDSVDFRLNLLFADVDGDRLTHAASALDPSVVSVDVNDSLLIVRAEFAGKTTIMVTARDPTGLEGWTEANVAVRWPPATGTWHGVAKELDPPVGLTLNLAQSGPQGLIGRASLQAGGRHLTGWLGSGWIDHPSVHLSGWGVDEAREIVFHFDGEVDRDVAEMAGTLKAAFGARGRSPLTLRRLVGSSSGAEVAGFRAAVEEGSRAPVARTKEPRRP